MSEGVEYHNNGTVTITIEDKAHRLRRPTFGQFRHFNRVYWDILEAANAELREAMEKLKGAEESEDAAALVKEVTADINRMKERPIYDRLSPILGEMFIQCGDPLPSDIDDWPAWLVTDPTVLPDILKHWRSVPKASGPKEKEASDG